MSQATPTGKDFTCMKCGDPFENPEKLKGHLRWCNGKCKTCGFQADNHGHFLYHRAMAHQPMFQCKICKLKLTNPDVLVSHILTHTEVENERSIIYSHFGKVREYDSQ